MGALADIRHAEAEAGGASQRVGGLQVEEAWTAQVAVGAHYVGLGTHTQIKGQGSEVRGKGNLWRAYLAGARTAGVAVGAAGQQALAGGAERKTREAEGAAVTAAAAEAPPTLTLTCRGRQRVCERE